VNLDKEGRLYPATHVDDYCCRDPELFEVNFYDFARCYKKIERGRSDYTEQGTLKRYKLSAPHKEADTHLLLQVIDPATKHLRLHDRTFHPV